MTDVKRDSYADVVDLASRREERQSTNGDTDGARKHGNGDTGGPSEPSDSERRLAAKRHNEGIKLLASGLTTLAAAVLTSAILIPLIRDPAAFVAEYRPVWYFVGVGLHIAAQVILRREMKSED